MEKESWGTNHGNGIIEGKSWRGIMGEESWKRNHGRGIMGEESWERKQGEGAPKRHPGGSQEASRRVPEGTQEAPRSHAGGPGGKMCKNHYVVLSEVK